MNTLTPQQIQFITDKVSKALHDALTEVAGINPTDAKLERMKARILATLAKSSQLINAYPTLAPILKHNAMPKTTLRRALGGNSVNIDQALDELVASGLILHHPANRITNRTLQVYELTPPPRN